LAVGIALADLAVQEAGLNSEGEAFEVNADAQGLLWISEYGAGEIWAFDPATGDHTVYPVTGSTADARRAADGSVWWIDQAIDALGRLSPASGDVTMWDLAGAESPFGTAVDELGYVWLSQSRDPQVYRFDVHAGQLCTYTLGVQGGSDYVLADGTAVWLGDRINHQIHRLDPVAGLRTSWDLPGNAWPEGLAMDGLGHLWWADPDLRYLARLEPEADRLTTYPVPLGGSTPEMLAVNSHRLWYTEDTLGTLGRLDPFLEVGTSQTLIPKSSALAPTCASIAPLSTGTLISTSGTTVWTGTAYTTTIDANGWRIHELPQDAYPWGIAAAGGQLWVVDNGRQVLAHVEDTLSAVACAEADADGDPSTIGDHTPLEGWTLYLTIDGIRQEPEQVTGATGCAVWDELDTGVNYGVEEDLPAGWAPIGSSAHAFGELVPGQANVHTFLNTQKAQVSACKVADQDGDGGTTGDRTPVAGWTVYLTVDGVRQEPGQSTGADGCATWYGLEPGSYGVEEEQRAGWTPLSATTHDFGLLPAGTAVSHTFVNVEEQTLIYLPAVLRQY
jgi:virginiamycin B lyase